MAKSKVYFTVIDDSDSVSTIQNKFGKLLDKSRLLGPFGKGRKIAVKIHFGEEGNTGYVNPEFVAPLARMLLEKKARPFLTDTNTLYKGRRANAVDHLNLALEHGFGFETAGMPLLIADGLDGSSCAVIKAKAKYIKGDFFIAEAIANADAIISLAHFKGHIMTGFGGTLKNLGMGCAARRGKLAQHSDLSPVIRKEDCSGCGECVKVCPAEAIVCDGKKALITRDLCLGCASCIAACPNGAIEVRWESGAETIQFKMIEYAAAALQGKKDNVFINFANKITKECDCLSKDDPRIVRDIGIFASLDPVSVDKATVDLINKAAGRDIFKEVQPKRDWNKQLDYARKMGMGQLEYELCAVDK